jgi:hypothetical protein
MTLLPQDIRSKRTSGATSCSTALKRSLFSVHNGTITHVLTISSQHVAVLAAGLLGRQVAPLHCTNRRHPEGPLLRHGGSRAGGRGGLAVWRLYYAHGTEGNGGSRRFLLVFLSGVHKRDVDYVGFVRRLSDYLEGAREHVGQSLLEG